MRPRVRPEKVPERTMQTTVSTICHHSTMFRGGVLFGNRVGEDGGGVRGEKRWNGAGMRRHLQDLVKHKV